MVYRYCPHCLSHHLSTILTLLYNVVMFNRYDSNCATILSHPVPLSTDVRELYFGCESIHLEPSSLTTFLSQLVIYVSTVNTNEAPDANETRRSKYPFPLVPLRKILLLLEKMLLFSFSKERDHTLDQSNLSFSQFADVSTSLTFPTFTVDQPEELPKQQKWDGSKPVDVFAQVKAMKDQPMSATSFTSPLHFKILGDLSDQQDNEPFEQFKLKSRSLYSPPMTLNSNLPLDYALVFESPSKVHPMLQYRNTKKSLLLPSPRLSPLDAISSFPHQVNVPVPSSPLPIPVFSSADPEITPVKKDQRPEDLAVSNVNRKHIGQNFFCLTQTDSTLPKSYTNRIFSLEFQSRTSPEQTSQRLFRTPLASQPFNAFLPELSRNQKHRSSLFTEILKPDHKTQDSPFYTVPRPLSPPLFANRSNPVLLMSVYDNLIASQEQRPDRFPLLFAPNYVIPSLYEMMHVIKANLTTFVAPREFYFPAQLIKEWGIIGGKPQPLPEKDKYQLMTKDELALLLAPFNIKVAAVPAQSTTPPVNDLDPLIDLPINPSPEQMEDDPFAPCITPNYVTTLNQSFIPLTPLEPLKISDAGLSSSQPSAVESLEKPSGTEIDLSGGTVSLPPPPVLTLKEQHSLIMSRPTQANHSFIEYASLIPLSASQLIYSLLRTILLALSAFVPEQNQQFTEKEFPQVKPDTQAHKNQQTPSQQNPEATEGKKHGWCVDAECTGLHCSTFAKPKMTTPGLVIGSYTTSEGTIQDFCYIRDKDHRCTCSLCRDPPPPPETYSPSTPLFSPRDSSQSGQQYNPLFPLAFPPPPPAMIKNRYTQILAETSMRILLILLKRLKQLSRAIFDYFCLSMVDRNGVLLLVKVINAFADPATIPTLFQDSEVCFFDTFVYPMSVTFATTGDAALVCSNSAIQAISQDPTLIFVYGPDEMKGTDESESPRLHLPDTFVTAKHLRRDVQQRAESHHNFFRGRDFSKDQQSITLLSDSVVQKDKEENHFQSTIRPLPEAFSTLFEEQWYVKRYRRLMEHPHSKGFIGHTPAFYDRSEFSTAVKIKTLSSQDLDSLQHTANTLLLHSDPQSRPISSAIFLKTHSGVPYIVDAVVPQIDYAFQRPDSPQSLPPSETSTLLRKLYLHHDDGDLPEGFDAVVPPPPTILSEAYQARAFMMMVSQVLPKNPSVNTNRKSGVPFIYLVSRQDSEADLFPACNEILANPPHSNLHSRNALLRFSDHTTVSIVLLGMRLLQKIVRDYPSRMKWLHLYKANNLLNTFRKIAIPSIQLARHKLFRTSMPLSGKLPTEQNSTTISAMYLGLPLKLCDPWLTMLTVMDVEQIPEKTYDEKRQVIKNATDFNLRAPESIREYDNDVADLGAKMGVDINDPAQKLVLGLTAPEI
ncbi:hypothetical protein BLNAU_383 [Blattamonas nauphoetae]|uniref:Far11/STRP C-terminal domain-containing protein n=1 Tax=Blattamonas nauphoetae TaxID=2049346 RepID=A0ABQ9YL43_9EUKA|nr:hypothetical protein BLNAU_383 [Blattamonas nauphoetae]